MKHKFMSIDYTFESVFNSVTNGLMNIATFISFAMFFVPGSFSSKATVCRTYLENSAEESSKKQCFGQTIFLHGEPGQKGNAGSNSLTENGTKGDKGENGQPGGLGMKGEKGFEGPKGDQGWANFNELDDAIKQAVHDYIQAQAANFSRSSSVTVVPEQTTAFTTDQTTKFWTTEANDTSTVFVTTGPPPEAKPGWFAPGNGFQYKLTDAMKDWDGTRQLCKDEGAELITGGSRSIVVLRNVINEVVESESSAWLGLRGSDDGSFVWVDGEEASRVNTVWEEGYPRNIGDTSNCGYLLAEDVRIVDRPCIYTGKGICEKSLYS